MARRYGRGYLLVSSLVRYKRIDLAIEACNQLKVPLMIVGEGPDRKRLERMAGQTITFVGYKNEEELRALYQSERATIFPGDEDFGLVPLESMASGTPVIAFRSGGALETILEGQTGEFFDEPTAASLAEAIIKSEQKKYSEEACTTQASKFSRQQFEEGLRQAIGNVMK